MLNQTEVEVLLVEDIKTYKLGVNSYIIKPVDFKKFSDAISELGYHWLILNQKPLPISP